MTSSRLAADKNDVHLFPVKVDEEVVKLHFHATQCGAHCARGVFSVGFRKHFLYQPLQPES